MIRLGSENSRPNGGCQEHAPILTPIYRREARKGLTLKCIQIENNNHKQLRRESYRPLEASTIDPLGEGATRGRRHLLVARHLVTSMARHSRVFQTCPLPKACQRCKIPQPLLTFFFSIQPFPETRRSRFGRARQGPHGWPACDSLKKRLCCRPMTM